MSKNENKSYLKKRIKSFQYAFNGCWLLIRNEHNARIHLFFTIIVIIGGFWLKISMAEWLLLLIIIGLVFVAEFLNTAIELLADNISKERHPYIQKAKDIAAGGVLFAAILSMIIGVIIFGPKLWSVVF